MFAADTVLSSPRKLSNTHARVISRREKAEGTERGIKRVRAADFYERRRGGFISWRGERASGDIVTINELLRGGKRRGCVRLFEDRARVSAK